MTSLTETAYYTRRTINWMIIGLFAYFILKILWGIFISIWLMIFPPQPPPPNHAFGVLPAVAFPQMATPSAKLSFTLQTISGNLPQSSNSAVVYFMPKSAPDFLALNNAQSFAAKLDFSPTAVQAANSKNLFQFNDTEYSLRTLRYDIVSNNFTLNYAYDADTSVFNGVTPPIPANAITAAQNIIQTTGLPIPDFASGNIQTTYLTLVGDTLVPTISVTQANAIRVDFQRSAVNGLNVYYSNPSQGPIYFIFSGANVDKKNVLKFNFTYWPADYHSRATYKLKTTAEAWQELQSGGGYIAHYPLNGTSVTVRDVHLGYYDSIEPQTYLQPIYVFAGDDGFMAYVSAVAAPWTQ